MSAEVNEGANNQEYTAPVIEIDTYEPSEMAARVGLVGISKTNLGTLTMLGLSILSGVFIALGTQLSVLVTHTATSNYGLNQLIGEVAFTLAMVLIVITGAELFAGNPLVAMSFMARKITGRALARSLIIVFIGNFIGGLMMVCWMYMAHQWEFFHYATGAKALLIAHKKVNLSFKAALVRGVLCNALLCLNVWLCYSSRSVADKVLSVLFPIGGFVASGFEHCVANMYFIPMGVILRKNPDIVAAAEKMTGKPLDLSQLSWKGFFINNLFPVTLGNFIGGVILVGIVCWFIYLRPHISYLSLEVKPDFSQNKKFKNGNY